MKVAYILETFPNISTTFVINEIVSMQEKEVEADVFAFIKGRQTIRHAKLEYIKNVSFFKGRQWGKMAYYHFWWLTRKPLRYLAAAGVAFIPQSGILKLFFTGLGHAHTVYLSRPDLLHAHFGKRPADFCMLFKMLTDTPFTFTTHGFDVHRQPAQNYLLKSLLSYKHVTISEFNIKVLRDRHKVPLNKLSLIRCGVDFTRNLSRTVKKEGKTIIFVGRLEYIKGADILIEACKKLADKMIEFRCLLVGTGPEKKELDSQIARLGLKDRVILAGPRGHEEVFDLLKKSSLMVLPSRSESLSVALMEAMACRVPVIGPDIMGNPELIQDGVSGFLVKPGDVEELTEKMIMIIEDETLAKKFSDAAYEKVRNDFNLQKETGKLHGLWQECLSKKRE